MPAAGAILAFLWRISVNRGDGKISPKLELLMAVLALVIAIPTSVLSKPCGVGELKPCRN